MLSIRTLRMTTSRALVHLSAQPFRYWRPGVSAPERCTLPAQQIQLNATVSEGPLRRSESSVMKRRSIGALAASVLALWTLYAIAHGVYVLSQKRHHAVTAVVLVSI